MPLPKRVLYYGLLAALTLLAVEGMARLAYFAAFAEWYGGSRPADAADNIPPSPPRGNENSRMLHPFYGYTVGMHDDELNVMPPPEQQDHTVLIGLFGGSVSQQVTLYFQRALSRYFTDNNLERRPVVLGLNTTAFKEPQQAMIAANALLLGGHFDIMVNLDGFNEFYIARQNFIQMGVFPFFDLGGNWVQGLTAAETSLVGRIGILRAEQVRRRRAASRHPLRYTAVYGIARRYRRERAERRIIRLNHDLAATRVTYSLEAHGPRSGFQDEQDFSREAARVWYRGSLLLAELANLTGAEYYHFLQPNQYVPDSKPLSVKELRNAYSPKSGQELYGMAYPLLAELGERLRRQQVNYFDLTYIFANEARTLYRDDCCHFNDRGNELLAAAMVERMAPALHRASTAAVPPSGLAAAARPQPELLLIIDAEWQVYRRGRYWLVYVRENCAPEESAPGFFLHIIPVDATDLPPERREYGFDNLDFRFADAGRLIGGRCTTGRQLPGYPIASIRTGQYIYGGDKLWEGEYRFVE